MELFRNGNIEQVKFSACMLICLICIIVKVQHERQKLCIRHIQGLGLSHRKKQVFVDAHTHGHRVLRLVSHERWQIQLLTLLVDLSLKRRNFGYTS